MRIKNHVVLGDKLDLQWGETPVYRSMVEDITEDGKVFISTPIHEGNAITIPNGQEMDLIYYRPNGRFLQKARTVGFRTVNDLCLLELAFLSEPEKQQRRDSYRLKKRFRADIRRLESGGEKEGEEPQWQKAIAENVSATGIGVKVSELYSKGDLVNLNLYLSGPENKECAIGVAGVVRNVNAVSGVKNEYRIGVEFLRIAEEDSRFLGRYIMKEQQRLLRQERLVEGR